MTKEYEPEEDIGCRQEQETNLTNNYSHVCPACGGHLDFWACEALCHYCGLKFTCDE